MKKKDFTAVYSQIEEATQEIESTASAQDVQETQKTRKPRKTYTEQEAQELLEAQQTSGRKGLSQPRINLAFSPQNFLYVKTMARVSGLNVTQFINNVIAQHMDAHTDIYQKAQEFRNDLKM